MYGADRQLLALVQASRAVCQPIVLLPDDVDPAGQLSTRLMADGVKVLRGPLPVLRRRYARAVAMPAWALRSMRGSWWILREARAARARVIISNSTAIPVGPVIAAVLRVPHVWFVREIIASPSWFRGVVRGMARISPGLVLTVSDAVAAWLGPLPGPGPATFHDGVFVPDERAPLPDLPSAVFVGRLNDWKGWDVFIRASGQAHPRVPGARFRLVGGLVEGGEIGQPDVQVALDAVDPSRTWLTWTGEVADARAAMRDAWLVAVPSVRPDPFPNVVIEAMSEGRAVIGSQLGGIPEMVDLDETGLLVPPDDPEALAEAMVRLLSDRSLTARFGEAGRQRAVVEFSGARFAAAWRDILQPLMGPHR
jgi:glycosyltransferase involved in cell wall biosynthesis